MSRIITHQHLSRRAVLRGLGATIGLPLLDAMVPALGTGTREVAAATKGVARLAFVYVPNGIVMEDWTPATAGRDFALPRILEPLAKLREEVLILSGLDDHNGKALGDGAGDHARAGASFLTGVHCKKTAGADIRGGVSADQIGAQLLAGRTRFASLEVGCEDSRTVGNCDSGYSCAYTNSLSWRTPTTPMPPEINPRLVFERLFGTEDPSLPAEVRARRRASRRSILDLVREETNGLTRRLGAADRRKIDEYLFAIREIETRIAQAEADGEGALTPSIEKPAGIPTYLTEYAGLMYDLLTLAFQADLTRIATFVLAREGSMRVYPEIGIPDPHHPLTHHMNNKEWIEKVIRINRYHLELHTAFLEKLHSIPDGDGTLLDRSMIVYGSGLSDGNRHLHERLPILLAGRGNGQLTPGRHLEYPDGTPVTNLYLSLLQRLGVEPEKIGDSTGKLAYL